MKEVFRKSIWEVGKIFNNEYLLNKSTPHYYRYAQENILCECSKCACPASSSQRYSFVFIDESSKLIYYDVPKAASTTIRNLLFGNKRSSSLRNPKEELNSYLKFTFVRNPWDRMVSNWKMFTTQPFRIDQLKAMTNMDLSNFEDFVDFAIDNANHHWQPQVLFTHEKLDFIGKMESFDDDMNRLLDMIGKKRVPSSYEKRNTTERKKYQEYYSNPSVIQKVAKHYHEDIETFGYTF